ncbi:MAG TPA: MerR family transcriptional regulator [Planctomycetota bacterium]|nr:MerR family transcriptional regulator [Planctomycetota bacterium]
MGRRIRAEEARYLDYREIEERSRDLGFPTSERTLRFYVTEGVLPPPPRRRGGKTPVYEEDWILEVLLKIHIMKTRQGMSLAAIREALRDGGATMPDDMLEEGSGLRAPDSATGDPATPAPAEPSASSTPEPETPMPQASLPEPSQPFTAKVTPLSLPEGAVLLEKARALEELFIGRFDEAMGEIQRVPHPIEQQLYPAGARDRIHLKRTRSDEVIDLMKRHRVFERELLEALPLDEVSEYRVFTRSLFGKKEVRVVLAACCVSPIEDFITRKCSLAQAGPRELERALNAVGPREDAFYYMGILSTTGWEKGVERWIPARPNLLVALVENRGGTEWGVKQHEDERWGGLGRLFDPESEREKVERVKRRLETHPELSLRGGHVIVKNLRADLQVNEVVLSAAIREVLARDRDLSLMEVGGKEILKRRRL